MIFFSILFLSSAIFCMEAITQKDRLNELNSFIQKNEHETELYDSIIQDDTQRALEVIKKIKEVPLFIRHLSVLANVVGHNNLKVVSALIKKDPEIVKKNQALGFVKSRAMADLLLNNGADPNKKQDGYTPLYSVVHCGGFLEPNIEVVEALLEKGANPNDIYEYDGVIRAPLVYAASQGFRAVCDKMIEYGADPLLPSHKSNALTNANDSRTKSVIIAARNDYLQDRIENSSENALLKQQENEWYEYTEGNE